MRRAKGEKALGFSEFSNKLGVTKKLCCEVRYFEIFVEHCCCGEIGFMFQLRRDHLFEKNVYIVHAIIICFTHQKSDCHAMSQNLAIVMPGLRIANIKTPIHPPCYKLLATPA